jgi:hypothetical protein
LLSCHFHGHFFVTVPQPPSLSVGITLPGGETLSDGALRGVPLSPLKPTLQPNRQLSAFRRSLLGEMLKGVSHIPMPPWHEKPCILIRQTLIGFLLVFQARSSAVEHEYDDGEWQTDYRHHETQEFKPSKPGLTFKTGTF